MTVLVSSDGNFSDPTLVFISFTITVGDRTDPRPFILIFRNQEIIQYVNFELC